MPEASANLAVAWAHLPTRSVSASPPRSGIGLGLAVFGAMTAMGRQPEAAGKIQVAMIIGCAFIEALTIYALISVFPRRLCQVKFPGRRGASVALAKPLERPRQIVAPNLPPSIPPQAGGRLRVEGLPREHALDPPASGGRLCTLPSPLAGGWGGVKQGRFRRYRALPAGIVAACGALAPAGRSLAGRSLKGLPHAGSIAHPIHHLVAFLLFIWVIKIFAVGPVLRSSTIAATKSPSSSTRPRRRRNAPSRCARSMRATCAR